MPSEACCHSPTQLHVPACSDVHKSEPSGEHGFGGFGEVVVWAKTIAPRSDSKMHMGMVSVS